VRLGAEGLTVACGEDQILLRTVQLEDGAEITSDKFVRVHDLRVGDTMSPRA
jgi:methionyl-tRNA formyltransferase